MIGKISSAIMTFWLLWFFGLNFADINLFAHLLLPIVSVPVGQISNKRKPKARGNAEIGYLDRKFHLSRALVKLNGGENLQI